MKKLIFSLLAVSFCIILSVVLFSCCKNENAGKIRKIIDPATNKIVYEKLCNESQWYADTNHHGGIREWYGAPVEPSECHIVLYTPGVGEGGGEQKVFCAGSCEGREICILAEEPDEEGALLYCKCISRDSGKIKKITDGSGTVSYEKIGDGWSSDTNVHGGICEWYGPAVEPSECHIVLYTPGEGEGGGGQRVFCAGGCPGNEECILKEEAVEGGVLLSCECIQVEGKIKKHVNPQTDSVTYEKLGDGGWYSSENQHGGIREWHGSPTEPSECHIVLYTPGEDEGGGEQRVFCAGSCPEGRQCFLVDDHGLLNCECR